MTPNLRSSPEPLVVYPYIHRNSQCNSCSSVIPGDICFNCGRLSTLLVTPPPPRNSNDRSAPAIKNPAPTYEKPVLQNQPFDAQYSQIQELLKAKHTTKQRYPEQRSFDSQLSEIENLEDARKKLAQVHTLAANDSAIISNRDSNSYRGRYSSSRGPYSVSSRTQSTCSSSFWSEPPRSESVASPDIFSEDGRPKMHIVARWLEDVEPSKNSAAKLTMRGVDCRLNLAGRSCEWVVFL